MYIKSLLGSTAMSRTSPPNKPRLVATDGGDNWTTATGWNSDYAAQQFVLSEDGTTLVAVAAEQTVGVKNGDVFASTDFGLTWSSLNFPGGAVQSIAENASGVWYVGTGAVGINGDGETGIYTFDGSNWEHLDNSPEMEITSVLADPSDENVLYATAADFNTSGSDSDEVSGLYTTTDGGATWTKLETGLSDGTKFRALARQSSTNTLYMAGTNKLTQAGEIYKSSDAGANWGLYYTGLKNETFNTLLFDGLVTGNTRGLYEVKSLPKISLKKLSEKSIGENIVFQVKVTDRSTGTLLKNSRVKLYKKMNGEWVGIKSAKTNNKGVVEFTVKLKHSRSFKARYFPKGGAAEEFKKTTSRIVSLHID